MTPDDPIGAAATPTAGGRRMANMEHTPSSTAALQPPPAVVEIVQTLRRAGHEAWCVGGAVRDALLGHAHLDWDLATSATPPQVRRLFPRTVPVGIEFGTIGVLDAAGVMHEVTTFRRDVQHDGRHAVVEFGASLDDDLARRDLTINAIAFDPLTRTLYDPFGGQDDLVRGVVRAVGVPEARMTEDRLRALRAIRFASRLGFSMDPATWQAIVASAPYLARLSPERVKQELEKTMEQVDCPSVAFARWREAGAFAALIPSLATVDDAVLRAIDILPRPGLATRPMRRSLRMAALFSAVPAGGCEAALKALRFSNQDTAWISALVDRWGRFGVELGVQLAGGAPPSGASLRRLAAAVGRLRVSAFVRLAAARWATVSAEPKPTARAVTRLYRQLIQVAFHDPIEVADLAIDGDDLRRAGVRPGPQFGQLLAGLLEQVLEDPARNTPVTLLALLPQLVADLQPPHR